MAGDAVAPKRRSGTLATVRMRTTAVSVAVVGVALVVAGVVLVVALRDSLTGGVRTAARLRAEDLAETLERGTAPKHLVLEAEDEIVVQVLDDRGRVVASSPNIGSRPLLSSPRAEHAETLDDVRLGRRSAGAFLVFTVHADARKGRLDVLVGRTLRPVEDSIDVVIQLLVVGLPVLLLVTGATAWWLAGRALAPVESIRSEVAAISASELHRRVPQPAGDDEVARLASTMNGMLARLDDAQARQRRLVSDASHELRSPVATIRQHVEVAQAHPAKTTVSDLAGVVLAEDLRLERLVDDLLWLARADEHRSRPPSTAVDVDDLVLEEATRLRGSHGVRVDIAGVSAGQVLGDAEELRHMLRNLGDNAARYARTTVALSLHERDGRVVLRVDDDGPGIPLEARSRVFERFTRLDDARSRDVGGSGLGLAIVAEIVAAHDGSVVAGDAPIGGARLEVSLPAAP